MLMNNAIYFASTKKNTAVSFPTTSKRVKKPSKDSATSDEKSRNFNGMQAPLRNIIKNARTIVHKMEWMVYLQVRSFPPLLVWGGGDVFSFCGSVSFSQSLLSFLQKCSWEFSEVTGSQRCLGGSVDNGRLGV